MFRFCVLIAADDGDLTFAVQARSGPKPVFTSEVSWWRLILSMWTRSLSIVCPESHDDKSEA